VFYDESVCHYQSLLNQFGGFIDPTQLNGQGNDRGTQYRTGIYFHTPEQQALALSWKEAEQKKHTSQTIATEVLPAGVYWPAEAEHQGYLFKGGRFGSGQSNAKGCNDSIRCYG